MLVKYCKTTKKEAMQRDMKRFHVNTFQALMWKIAETQGLVGNLYLTQSQDKLTIYITVTLPCKNTAIEKNWNDLRAMDHLQRKQSKDLHSKSIDWFLHEWSIVPNGFVSPFSITKNYNFHFFRISLYIFQCRNPDFLSAELLMTNKRGEGSFRYF